MKKSCHIWIFLLMIAAAIHVEAQGVAALSSQEQFYLERALSDGEYEHGLKFSRTADEIDFWNDQRSFEQRLFNEYPEHYRSYLKGKHLSYIEHQGVCKGTCGHGDYYLRQASFYLQYNSGDQGDFLTLTQLQGDRGWEVSFVPGNHH